MTGAPQTLRWGHAALEVEIDVGEDCTARLTRIGLPGGTPPERRNWPPLPLLEVTATGHGRAWSSGRLIDSQHNGGGWHWECGERDQLAYLALFGPTDTHHGWRHPLGPGGEFHTVPVALAFSADGGPDDAFAALTRYRRTARRPHSDHRRLPVIFNDYMKLPDGRPHNGETAAADRRGGRGGRGVLRHRRRLVRRRERRLVGTASAPGSRPPPDSPGTAGSTRCWTASGCAAWCPACGWSRR